MLLYRLSKEEEILKILDTRKTDVIGAYCSNNPKLNNHIYQKDKKYLHFFLSEYEITNLNPQKGKYICTYDIPKDIVNAYLGFGYYLSVFDLETSKKITECAIPCELISFQNLIKIEKITKTLDFEDYLDDIREFKETIYELPVTKKVRRKNEKRRIWKY